MMTPNETTADTRRTPRRRMIAVAGLLGALVAQTACDRGPSTRSPLSTENPERAARARKQIIEAEEEAREAEAAYFAQLRAEIEPEPDEPAPDEDQDPPESEDENDEASEAL